jgi:Tol biopolymer transport system component/DNA-binding winged helix-turn-helix (wHTH) protein
MDSCRQAPKSVRFGLFEANFATGELRKNGRRVKLQEQPFQVLALLVQRAGQVVSREELQKTLWPADTFVEFEQGINTAVKKIRQGLNDSAENPRFIETLPRKGYRFIAPILDVDIPTPSTSPPPVDSRSRLRPRWFLAFIALSAIALVLGWFIGDRNTSSTNPLTPVPLTSYPGRQMEASFSPDARQVAFVWNGEKEDNFDIYVKLIGSDALLRITSDPAADFSPAWSPDGGSIAYLRQISATRQGVFLRPAIGGPEQKLTEVDCCQFPMEAGNLAWSPNGKWLAIVDRTSPGERRSILLLSPEDSEKQRLTSPSAPWESDRDPAFSPDGRELLFVRRNASASNGEPLQLTFGNDRWISGAAWASNTSTIIVSAMSSANTWWLWRLHLPVGNGAPERLPSFADDCFEPVIACRAARLAYTRVTNRTNTWRAELPSQILKAPSPVRLLSSSRADFNAQYSPDDKRIAFHSTRSGWSEIWVCNRDGTNARQLTFLRAPMTGSPRWAPDNNHIVFDSNVSGRFALYTINVDGGKPRRLTTSSADDAVGSWSRDGKSIYFASNRSGDWQVWKMPAEGGDAFPITRNGGRAAFESPDDRFVYYSKARGQTSLWRVPAGGGEERQVLESVSWLSFAVVSDGIYFVPGKISTPNFLRFFNFRTGAIKPIAPIAGGPDIGLSVSSDRRYILYAQSDRTSQLKLVENFR